jgi:hypothetical protein
MEVMKNIHVIPTDKPSRLGGSEYIVNIQGIDKRAFKLKLWNKIISNKDLRDVGYIPQNIYITSDEEIKEGDFYLYCNQVTKRFRKNTRAEYPYPNYQKIILTTDQDLIKDGVQAIDDEFLEWFVKNPSCEFVEINKRIFIPLGTLYDIIIPQEEPKQEGYICPQTKLQCRDECCVSAEDCHIEAGFGIISDCEPPKQETLEEVDEYKKNLYFKKQVMNPYPVEEYSYTAYEKGFIEGYEESGKYQAERSYNEEEVNNMFATLKINSVNNVATITNVDLFISSWKKQFKKK